MLVEEGNRESGIGNRESGTESGIGNQRGVWRDGQMGRPMSKGSGFQGAYKVVTPVTHTALPDQG
ncbi:hypothetical protein LYNGBM3L_25060 [Moorena producens 3L]|uniref:Uncharacterized protein n=1 Tax=Moorena producens 3L TaxID=489825 RepID=F4XP12_9CYAN|nr:hypothetical protein LYNGBM3L_25060 [Moorena producens 3L]OLT64489.1 hypothetical protein BI334_05125 [Moorena producens 3L]